jgi:DNA-binding response OmpR family regulator
VVVPAHRFLRDQGLASELVVEAVAVVGTGWRERAGSRDVILAHREKIQLLGAAKDERRMRVLVVEDEQMLADALGRGLRLEGMAVDVVYDGDAAVDLVTVNDYDVVVLDRDLPGIHGDDVCRTIIAHRTTARVLMLTAAADVNDRVEGLGLGADDYVGKPFAFAELAARVWALSRRSRESAAPVLVWQDLRLDRARMEATRCGRPLQLSRKEFGVLEELMRADGGVVSAEQLMDKVWDENADPFSNVVRVTMVSLRRKLGLPLVVQTVRGAGYQLELKP